MKKKKDNKNKESREWERKRGKRKAKRKRNWKIRTRVTSKLFRPPDIYSPHSHNHECRQTQQIIRNIFWCFLSAVVPFYGSLVSCSGFEQNRKIRIYLVYRVRAAVLHTQIFSFFYELLKNIKQTSERMKCGIQCRFTSLWVEQRVEPSRAGANQFGIRTHSLIYWCGNLLLKCHSVLA